MKWITNIKLPPFDRIPEFFYNLDICEIAKYNNNPKYIIDKPKSTTKISTPELQSMNLAGVYKNQAHAQKRGE